MSRPEAARRVMRSIGLVLGGVMVLLGGRGLWILASGPAPGAEAWDARTVAQLRFLSDGLDRKADAMQRQFPEGRLFTLALTGIAWAEVDRPDLRTEALEHARRALALVEAEPSTATFGPAGGLPHGMFYEAWTARLRAAVLRLDPEAADVRDALRASCDRLDGVLASGPLHADSYPGAAWPADNVVGAAALAACGDLVAPRYRDTAEAWLVRARQEVDPETGLIPHAAGRPEARGSSSALMIPFWAEVDPAFAEDQYRAFVSAFATRLGGVAPTFREYPTGVDGLGDVDSGPLVTGVSAPASVVGIAAALSVGDAEAARALRASTEAVGVPVQWG
ncbi:MAG: hypothetical protein AAGJ11_18125, partial [Bacteroidota bacterium]